MSPEDIKPEWVDAAEVALADRCNNEHEGGRDWCGCPDEDDVRLVLAAVLPEAMAEAWDEGKEALAAAWHPDAAPLINPYREGSPS
jgi:hypothetical protein